MNSEEIPDFLKGRAGGNPFRVPDTYFDSFPARMQSRIAADEKQRISIFLRFSSLFRPAGIIAIAVIFILAGIVAYRSFNEPSALTNDEIALYCNQQGLIDDLDESELIELTGYSSAASVKNSAADEEASAIQHYLLEEEIEMNDIINEL